MTTESLIGITSGLIGIGTFLFAVWTGYKKLSLADTMNRLVDKNLSTKRHQRILKWMNILLPSHPISPKYIQDFVLNDRRKEAVFKDICLKNNIEPTKEICMKFLKADMPKFRKEYQSKKQKSSPLSNEKGESVFMSELLKERYPETCNRLTKILEKHHIHYSFLKGTKDIWCRDYMPVQTPSGKLIQFKYDPSYLKGDPKLEVTRSDMHETCKLNNIHAEFSDINLDGGNVLICEDRAILSDRIFSENPDYEKESLIKELSRLLECEIIIIPSLRSKDEDFTGHADGMVRFVDRNTIVGNNRTQEYKYWQEGINKVLGAYNLTYIDMPCVIKSKDSKHPDSAIGIYVNYLDLNKLIVVPVFGVKEDNEAVAVLKKAFPNKAIETIDYNDVALEGGLVNCTTWVIK